MTNSQPYFSVIIPTYNRAACLGEAVASVLAQTFADLEVIVVDDGSTDDTRATVAAISDARLAYHYQPNSERGAARNAGTQRAVGHYVTFLDSDDRLYPHCLQTAHAAIARHQQPGFLHVAYEIVRPAGPPQRIDYLRSDDVLVLHKGNPLSCLGCFLRADVAQRFRFNEDRALAGSEDWELWLRVAANAGLKTDNRVSAALVEHPLRSVTQASETQLLRRKAIALSGAFADPAVVYAFGPVVRQMMGHFDTYISLHLLMARQNRRALRYLWRAFRAYPGVVLERRFLAIVKRWLHNTFAP